jgi:2-iminobutanoate/2-iminopropanoate deaminase
VSATSSPPPAGPYRAVVRAGEWVVCSGQLGVRNGDLVAGGTGAELREAIENLAAVLATEGLGLADVVKTTVFLTDMAAFDEMNAAYLQGFGDHRPARSAVGVVALPRGGSVEIEAWARRA